MRRWLVHVQNALVVSSGALVTILIFVEVVTRYVFNKPLFGADELAGFTAVWLYFIGAAAAAEEGMHISASLTDLFIKRAWIQRYINLIVDAVSAIGAVWMSVWCWQFFWWSYVHGKMSLELGVPMAVFNVIVPLGMSLIACYHVLDFIMHARQRFEAHELVQMP